MSGVDHPPPLARDPLAAITLMSPAARLEFLLMLGPGETRYDEETGEKYQTGAGILTEEQIQEAIMRGGTR